MNAFQLERLETNSADVTVVKEMKNMYKLLIVEDEHLIRRYLTDALDYQELNITVVGDAENGQEGTAMIQDL